jgi:hypothetical protein
MPLSAAPATSLAVGVDDLTQISGIRWDGNSAQYKLRLRGHVQKGPTSWGILLGAYKSTTGVVEGPVCSYYDDVVCNPGGPYYGVCHNNQLSVHLLGHNSQHAVSYQWNHFIPGAQLVTPQMVSTILNLPVDICLATYRATLTVTGHDPSDKKSCIAFIFIDDDAAPVILNIYERDISAEPHDIPVPMLLTAEDQCDPNVQIKFSEVRVNSNHACSYQLHRTWTAEDDCGNTASHTQVINVVDTEAPTLTGVEEDQTYECDVVPPPCTVEGNDYNDVTVDIREYKQEGPCDCQYRLTRHWTATDCAGNKAVDQQVITVVDDKPPQIFGVPEDITVECDQVPSIPTPSATDNCCGATLSYFDRKTPGTCLHEYTITRTWSAVDSCGNKDTESQLITVIDNTPPVMSEVEHDITVECDEVPLPCEITVIDVCDKYVQHQFHEQTITDSCTDMYVIDYDWDATDECGNTAGEQQHVYVIDSTPPTLSGLPPKELTVDCDALPTFYVSANDNCDPGVSVDEGSSVIETLYTHDYVKKFWWQATDRCGNPEYYEMVLTVQDNELPVLIGVPDDILTTCESVPEKADVEATDNCCENYALTPTFNEITNGGTCPESYTLIRTWTVTDCSHNTHSESQQVTVEDNQAPVLHGLPGFDIVKCDDLPETPIVTATDNCDAPPTPTMTDRHLPGSCKTQYKTLKTWTAEDLCGNVVSYTQTIVVFDDEAPVLTNVPDDTTVPCFYDNQHQMPDRNDSCDPYLEIVPDHHDKPGTCEYDHVYYRHWSVEDDCGNRATADQTIWVHDIEAPTWTSTPEPLINSEYPTEPTPVPPTATDNCEYEPEITFNERKLQFGYLCPKAYRLVRAWFVVDLCGNMGTPVYQHVVIDDSTPPTFLSNPEDITIECDNIPPPYPVHASDHYEDIVVTLVESTDFGTCNQDYDITRVWTALDSCGNINTTTQVISVVDTEKPVLWGIPDDTTAECDAAAPAIVTAEDNCDGYIDVSLVNDDTTYDYDQYTLAQSTAMKTVTRHWRVSDNCGNVAEDFQTILVYDTKWPYFVSKIKDVVAECDDVPEIPQVVVKDDCDDNPKLWLQPGEETAPCEDEGTLIRIWYVEDHVGHKTSLEQVVTIVDTTPPEIAGYVQDTISVECDAVPLITAFSLTATDNCDNDVDVVPTQTKVDPFYACEDQYLWFYTWTASDNCGNTASYTKTISVDDSTPPVLSCDDGLCSEYVGGFEVECEDDFLKESLVVDADDNCDDAVAITPEHVIVHGTCDDAYLRISTWTAKDNCGNIASYTRTITVVDSTPPTWDSTPNASVTLTYQENPGCPKDMAASDLCDDDVAVSCDSVRTNGICEEDYLLTCTCTAVDDCGNSVEFVQVVNVYDDEPPVITEVPTTTVECLSSLVAPSEPHVDWGYGSGKLSVIQRTIPDSCEYVVTYIWTAMDDCKLTHTITQSVVVVDDTPPVIYNVPDDETVDCHPSPPAGYLSGEDNCDGKVLVVYDSEKISSDGPYCYTLVRSWSAVDHCGHIEVETQTVTVDDNEPPQVSYPPSQLTTDCHSLPFASEEDIHVADNCDQHRNVTFSDVKDPGTCDCEWMQYRTWVACDSCGNCVTVYATVTVKDDVPPALSLYPGDLTVQTGDVPYSSDVVGYDTYGSEVEVTFTEDRYNSSYAANSEYMYYLVRHWVTEDDCGNREEKTQTITVIDTIPVPVVGVPKDITLPCIEYPGGVPAQYQTAAITQVVMDNTVGQGPGITVTTSTDVHTQGTCDSEWVWIRCWQTEDHSSNVEEACFTITVVDTVPPHFTTFPEVEYADCEPKGTATAADASAVDNCWTGVTVTLDEDDQTGGAYSGYFARTWTATDACGHTAIHSQTVWISDTEPPVWDQTPPDTTVCCDNVPAMPNLNANDGCHGSVEVVHVSWKEIICEGEYIIFYNWRAIDDQGNWISWQQQVTVEDCESPVLYAGSFGSYVQGSSLNVSNSPQHEDLEFQCPWTEVYHSLYAKDECSEYPWDVPLFSVDRWGSDCLAYVAFHWETADDCGNEVSWDQTITIKDTAPPTLSGCPTENQTLHCGTPLPQPYVGATDDCDPFLDVIRSEKVIPGSCDFEYDVEITWTVTDRCGLQDSCTQTITFEDTQDPILTLHASGNVTDQCDAPYDVPAVSASDDCQDYFDISYDQDKADGTCPCEYTLYRKWTTADRCGKEAEVTQTITVVDGVPPVLSDHPKDVTVPCLHIPPKPPMSGSDNCCDVTLEYDDDEKQVSCIDNTHTIRTWTLTDECGLTDTYTYTITVIDTDPPAFTLGKFVPKFLKVECDSIPAQADLAAYDICAGPVAVTPDEFTHTADCLDSYFLFRHWFAEDNCGNSVELRQTVQVMDTTPPTLDLPDPDSYECDYVPNESNHAVTADDNCDPDPHVQFNKAILGADCSDSWAVMMMWTATDRCGNQAIFSLVVAIDDTLYPILTGVPADTTVECFLPDVPHVTVTDDCDKLLTAKFEQELPYSECPYVYSVIRRWSATDRCQNTVEQTQNIVITDDGPPTLIGVPADDVAGCKDLIVVAHVQGKDECENFVDVTVDQNVVAGSCPFQYLTIITWTAEDKCGNSVTDEQTITVHDQTPPTLTEPPTYSAANCDNIPEPPLLHAEDECSYALTIKYQQSTIDGTCDNEYTLRRTWVTVDECGNKDDKVCEISVTDTVAPTFIGIVPGPADVPCYDVPLMPTLSAEDDCDGYVHYSQGEDRMNGSCPNSYELTRWYRAVDVCGNAVDDSYLVTVTDTDPPVLSSRPADDIQECNTYVGPPVVTAIDNCGEATVETHDEVTVGGTCDDYLSINSWTATDECGWTDEHTQTISHVDTTPPVIDEHEDVTCEIGNIPPPWNCTWTDNCDDEGSAPFDRQKSGGSCRHAYTLKYTCVATDCDGNTATASHVVHVFDFTPPVIVGVGPNVRVPYQKFPPRIHANTGITVTDNSDSGETAYSATLLKTIDVKIPGYDKNDYVVIRTYSAKDDCDNKAVVHQTITVYDDTPPCFDEEPADITVECDAIPEPCDIFTVGEDLHVEFFVNTVSVGYGASLIKRKWKATDHSGNSYEHEQHITVEDTTPPVFTRKPDNATYECDCEGFPAIATLAAVDNCDEFVTVSQTEIEINWECPDNYTLVRTWIAQDHAGMQASYSQTIVIQDTTPPEFSSDPQDSTYGCDELTFDSIQKYNVYDNCDDDVDLDAPASPVDSEPVADSDGCRNIFYYEATAQDDCGHKTSKYWSTTISDDTPPSVVGSKHCVTNRSANISDGYGSEHLYAQFELDDLVTFQDNCETAPFVSSVWFNRSTDDKSNIFETMGYAIQLTNSGSYDCTNGPRTEKFEVGPIDVQTGQTYVLSFDAMQGPCNPNGDNDHNSFGKVIVMCGTEPEVWQISPHSAVARVNSQGLSDWNTYHKHFTCNGMENNNVLGMTVSIIFESEGVLFKLKDMFDIDTGVADRYNAANAPVYLAPVMRTDSGFPRLSTFHGEGQWLDIYGEGVSTINHVCHDHVVADNLRELCSQFTYIDLQGGQETYDALPAFRDDRFCYRSTTRLYRSWMHWRFKNNMVYWILTDFASENPSAYNWMDLDSKFNQLDSQGLGPQAIVDTLKGQGFILDHFPEQEFRNPITGDGRTACTPEGVAPAPTQKQCQGACYYRDYPLAFRYEPDSVTNPGECICAKDCTFSNEGPLFKYTVTQWFEGFFLDGTKVNILAMTDYDDLNIQMWVKVSDRCGNSAVAKVEFWVAPSLEAAAAQGRVCASATYTPEGSTLGAFSSDDPTTPTGNQFLLWDDAQRIQSHADILNAVGSSNDEGNNGVDQDILNGLGGDEGGDDESDDSWDDGVDEGGDDESDDSWWRPNSDGWPEFPPNGAPPGAWWPDFDTGGFQWTPSDG